MASMFFFLQSLLCLYAVSQFFFVLSNMTTSLLTSSFHPFLGLPAGFLPPQLPSTIRFWILLSNVITLLSAHFNAFKCMYVARSLILYSLRCFVFSMAINLYQYKRFAKYLFLLRTDRVWGTLMHERWWVLYRLITLLAAVWMFCVDISKCST